MDLVHSGQAALTRLIHTTIKCCSTVANSTSFLWPLYQALPVAGLDVLTAQTVLYSTLRTSLPADQVDIPASADILGLKYLTSPFQLFHGTVLCRHHLKTAQASSPQDHNMLPRMDPLAIRKSCWLRRREQNRRKHGCKLCSLLRSLQIGE